LERGIAVRQGLRFLHAELPRILATSCDALSPRMVRVIEDLAGDWRRLDERIERLSSEIEALARQDTGCERLMSVSGVGPIISSAMVAAIGAGEAFSKGRDFAACGPSPQANLDRRSHRPSGVASIACAGRGASVGARLSSFTVDTCPSHNGTLRRPDTTSESAHARRAPLTAQRLVGLITVYCD
jgi:hypothetical protein